MLGGFLHRARRVHPAREDNTTIEIRKASALPENNNLRQVTQLKLLNRLKAAGANVNDVMTVFNRSTAREAAGNSDERQGGEMKYDSTKEALIFKLLRPKKYTESTTSCSEKCCVCQEEYKEDEKVAVLKCRHKFHAGCIARWVTQRNLCPICKRNAFSLV